MFKLARSSFITMTLSLFLLSACADHSEAMKVLPNELAIADSCKNPNKKLEMEINMNTMEIDNTIKVIVLL